MQVNANIRQKKKQKKKIAEEIMMKKVLISTPLQFLTSLNYIFECSWRLNWTKVLGMEANGGKCYQIQMTCRHFNTFLNNRLISKIDF